LRHLAGFLRADEINSKSVYKGRIFEMRRNYGKET